MWLSNCILTLNPPPPLQRKLPKDDQMSPQLLYTYTLIINNQHKNPFYFKKRSGQRQFSGTITLEVIKSYVNVVSQVKCIGIRILK